MHSKAHDERTDPSTPASLRRWVRTAHDDDALIRALVEGRVAGPVTSHDRRNVGWKLDRLVAGDPDLQFGLTGLTEVPFDKVVALMADEAGFDPDSTIREGPTPIDARRVLAACKEAGRRLGEAARRGDQVLLATGHPVGLILLYQAVARLLEEHGGLLLRPLSGVGWREAGHYRSVQYLGGVAVLGDRGGTKHTHAPVPMEWMLEAVRPDLVFADHGFAGAAIERGIETISIADVNDPALVVAKHLGMTDTVIVMDDNVRPEAYWPCFQAIASAFPE
jgi:hypothetical protein